MTPPPDAATAEEAIAAFVSDASSEALLALLPEQHPLYAGRSANETNRIRGFVLAAFEKRGLPDGALPYVLEELQTGFDAYLVAAAARALRGTAADPRFIPFLRKAQENIRYRDAPVTFDCYKPRWPVASATTASAEIRKTLSWIGDGDCCEITFAPDRSRRTTDIRLDLVDQDGRSLRFRDFFRGKLSVVAFFYTRCDNPEKCSLTIARLARLQNAIENGPLRGHVRLAAITYDPAYDLPDRMKRFGENRGVRFNDDVRFFRAPAGLDVLGAQFDLGVNFIGALVNRHRIELYVLDERGNIVATFTRMQWDVDAVIAELERIRSAATPFAALASLPALFLALLPKCPLCVGAYLSAIGLGGLQVVADRRWTIPLVIVLLAWNIWAIARRSRRTQNLAAIALAATGAATLVANMALWSVPSLAFAGAALIVVASLLSAWGAAVPAASAGHPARRLPRRETRRGGGRDARPPS